MHIKLNFNSPGSVSPDASQDKLQLNFTHIANENLLSSKDGRGLYPAWQVMKKPVRL
jgi:hypothetical protein